MTRVTIQLFHLTHTINPSDDRTHSESCRFYYNRTEPANAWLRRLDAFAPSPMMGEVHPIIGTD